MFRIGDILSKAKVDKHFIIFFCFGGIFPKQLIYYFTRASVIIYFIITHTIFKTENIQMQTLL